MVRPFITGCVALWIASAGLVSAGEPPRLSAEVVVVGRNAVHPIAIPYSDDLTVAKAIIRAGGISDFARTRVYLIRCAKSNEVDLRAIIEGGQRDKDIRLEPWDVIVVGGRAPGSL